MRNTYGEIGILDMPSARMAADGDLAFTVGGISRNQRYNLSIQVLPWLEGSFRFSALAGFYYDRSFSTKVRLLQESKYLPDLSVGIRDLLGTGVYSSEYIVANKRVGAFDLSVGGGWGRLADRSVMGNPLGDLISSFKSRPWVASDGTGKVEFGKFFHGKNLGIFGGAIWQTPIEGVRVLAEYSSDKYSYDARYAKFTNRSPINLGLSYQIFDNLAVSAGWMYGNTYAFTVSLRGNPNEDTVSQQRIGPDVPRFGLRDPNDQYLALKSILALRNDEAKKRDLRKAIIDSDTNVRGVVFKANHVVVTVSGEGNVGCGRFAALVQSSDLAFDTVIVGEEGKPAAAVCAVTPDRPVEIATQLSSSANGVSAAASVQPSVLIDSQTEQKLKSVLRERLSGQGLILQALQIKGADLWLYYQNGRYDRESQAIGRMVRILSVEAPPSVEYFHFVPVVYGMAMQDVSVVRNTFERSAAAFGTSLDAKDAYTLASAPMRNPALDAQSSADYPQWSWSIDPKMTEHVFDPDDPMQFMFYANAGAAFEPAPGWELATSWTANLWNDYNFSRDAGSALPHVRTDLMKYTKKSYVGMGGLAASYRTRLAPDLYASAKIGYLEDMYAGVGGQILWRPQESRFAFGADLYQVWKRDFNRMFGLQNYKVTTGHVSVYYHSPWYGLNFNVHAGRYLAGDRGATFEITRRFSSGVEIGAFATFTNVPFSKFGEGSFDKGIIIHIPLQWALPIFSQSSYDLHMSSLTRDGGQRLDGDDSLYDETERTSHDEISRHFSEILAP